jgi:hypothetical protein
MINLLARSLIDVARQSAFGCFGFFDCGVGGWRASARFACSTLPGRGKAKHRGIDKRERKANHHELCQQICHERL